jgi:hypothetical protein
MRGALRVHAPGVGVTVPLRRQEIAVCRPGIDAGQHGCCTLEDLVVQAHANARQVLLGVNRARLPRGRLEHIVDVAHADG